MSDLADIIARLKYENRDEMSWWLDKIERLAFNIPAPNVHTSQIVGAVGEARRAYNALRARQAMEPKP
jgi:hypothetical protein